MGLDYLLPHVPAWELRSQREALLTVPSTKAASLEGTRERAFSSADPQLWNTLSKGGSLGLLTFNLGVGGSFLIDTVSLRLHVV